MNENNWEQKNIAIKDLSLWGENARFPEENFKKTDEELIEYFLSDKKFGIRNMAEEIVNDFDIPLFTVEPLIVVKVDDQNIVHEGNRRLTAYKLLAEPDLAKKEEDLTFFSNLSKKIKIDKNYEITVSVTSSLEDACRIIDRKHNKNNNEKSWTSVERGHFAVRRKKGIARDFFKVEMSKEVKKLVLPEDVKFAILGKGYETTFWRIIENGSIKQKLCFDITEDGKLNIKNNENFKNGLKIIVYNIWRKVDFSDQKIDSRGLNKSIQIKEYSERIDFNDIKKVDNDVKSNEKETLFGDMVTTNPGSGSKKGNRSAPLSDLRKYLIDNTIHISDGRINDIYNELKSKIVVDDAPNAVAVLFRVFIECSIDCYINKYKILIKDDEKLANKILKVVEHVENDLIRNDLFSRGITNPTDGQTKGSKKKVLLTNIRKFADKSYTNYLNVATFNGFIHNYKYSPIPSELKKHWKNLSDFFVLLWDYIN